MPLGFRRANKRRIKGKRRGNHVNRQNIKTNLDNEIHGKGPTKNVSNNSLYGKDQTYRHERLSRAQASHKPPKPKQSCREENRLEFEVDCLSME